MIERLIVTNYTAFDEAEFNRSPAVLPQAAQFIALP